MVHQDFSEQEKSARPCRPTLTLGLAVAISLILKLWLALTTFGSNDVFYWSLFQKWIMEHGSVSIYRDFALNGVQIYNHPPLMSLYLWLIDPWIARVPNGFSLLIRLPAILADCITPWVVISILQSAFPKPATSLEGLFAALMVALSPILIQVSGFHGNTDPIFLLFLCLAIHSLVVQKSSAKSGFFFSLAVNIKIVPLFFLPLLFYSVRGMRERLRFSVAAAVTFLTGYGYHLWRDFDGIRASVFGYGSNPGIWGLTKLARKSLKVLDAPSLLPWISSGLKVFLLAAVAWQTHKMFTKKQMHTEAWRKAVVQGMGMNALFFFVFTPGFGVQYLAWIAVLGTFLGNLFAGITHLLAGIFLFGVYTTWCGGIPWDFADSDRVGQWHGWVSRLDSAIWLFFLIWLLKSWPAFRREHMTHEK